MKDCVDSAISRKAEIKILGFQCVGYKINFYVLDLKGDGVYAMNHIAQISVPATIRDLFTLIDELYVLLNIWVSYWNLIILLSVTLKIQVYLH